ncbi:MAG: polysaccharide deacetylase family protein, partial [Chloroflexi bacterium]|nr:polysaccharide deacetylase family protein [Chloroflexota bacterium]
TKMAATPTLADTATPTNTPTNTPTSTPTNTPTAVPPTITPNPNHTATPTVPPPPLPTPQGAYSWTLKVPILMYHYISTPPDDADVYRIDLSVEPEDFREQLAYLADNGYTPIDLYDLSRAITNKRELPEKPVILTFDDGYRDNYEYAFPILEEFGFKGTFFVVTEFIDFGREEYMTWDMISEMAAAGHRFEPHSRTHPDLTEQEKEFLIWQILGPQETLAHHIGYPPRYFAYPSGQYDDGVITVLKELDYWGAVTTMSGKWHGFDNRYQWARLRIRNNTPLPEFIDLIDPGDTVGGKNVEP